MQCAYADTNSTSTANGGAGGAGGNAQGGVATGGMATGGSANNSTNTSGVSSATGGAGGAAQGGAGGSAQGGASQATAGGGNVGSVSTGGSSASLGDVTVNYNVPGSPMGKDGLGVGVDSQSGHIVTDNNVTYSGSYKLKNTPEVSIGGPASGPCNGFSGGIGFSMAGIGIGANTSTVDPGCTARETARVAAMIGRMDIANAVLENLPMVQEAMRARAARGDTANPSRGAIVPEPHTPSAAPAAAPPAAPPADAQAAASNAAALKQQMLQAQEALGRQATMTKLNDTLRFTDASSQAQEKTPQQVMAEEANRQLAARSPAAAPSNGAPATLAAAPLPVAAQATPPPMKSQSVAQDAGAQSRSSTSDTDGRAKAMRALNFQ
jgi:hypothetical protein